MAKTLPYKPNDPPVGEAVQNIPVEKLLLDTENPRLELPKTASQETVLVQLHQDHRLEELMSSLISNGYFHEEPLVAVPAKNKKGFFVVVEGNRRLAALKLLLDEQLAAKLKVLGVPDASSGQLDRLRQVPVKVYAERQEVLPYLGFRHITGIKEWDAASKARYIYQLKHSTSHTLDDIARMIGDTYNMTERLYLGWSLLQQAEVDLGITRDDFVKFPFSYMYDAVRMPEVRSFLGVKPGKYEASHKGELKELVTWLFGSRSHEQQPIVERKDQLKRLAYAVSDKRGTTALRRGMGLDDAYSETVGELDQLLTWLTRAGKELDKAKGVIHRHKKHSEVQDLVSECADTASRLLKEVRP